MEYDENYFGEETAYEMYVPDDKYQTWNRFFPFLTSDSAPWYHFSWKCGCSIDWLIARDITFLESAFVWSIDWLPMIPLFFNVRSIDWLIPHDTNFIQCAFVQSIDWLIDCDHTSFTQFSFQFFYIHWKMFQTLEWWGNKMGDGRNEFVDYSLRTKQLNPLT